MFGLNNSRNSAIGVILSILPQACGPANTQRIVEINIPSIQETISPETTEEQTRESIESLRERLRSAMEAITKNKDDGDKILREIIKGEESEEMIARIEKNCSAHRDRLAQLKEEINEILGENIEKIATCMGSKNAGKPTDNCLADAIIGTKTFGKEAIVLKYEEEARLGKRILRCLKNTINPKPKHVDEDERVAIYK